MNIFLTTISSTAQYAELVSVVNTQFTVALAIIFIALFIKAEEQSKKSHIFNKKSS